MTVGPVRRSCWLETGKKKNNVKVGKVLLE